MIAVQFTYDEVQALVDFIWGEESDQEALRTANNNSQPRWTRPQIPGRPASGNYKLNPGSRSPAPEVAVLWPARGWSGRPGLP
jgi:hypothetical protein